MAEPADASRAARRRAALAVPGDLGTLSGGYGYDRRLLVELRALGLAVSHLELGASFPEPSAADMAGAAALLAGVPPDQPVLVDGLALGAMDPAVPAAMQAPLVALVHHPLALETGLTPKQRDRLVHSERANLQLAAHVVVTSPHTATLLCGDYGVDPERITVARPGTDRIRGRDAPSDPPLVLSVGIQVPRKGHDVLLRALARVRDRRWQAVIVGPALDARHAALLWRLVSELGLTGRVRLAGRVRDDELAGLYRQAQLFALATRYEGYGIVFDEAMAHGLPVVSCRTGAVPDTLAPGAGLLVPAEDPQAFAEALGRLLDDEALRKTTARASAAAGAALPQWTDTARRVADVIHRVAEGGLE